MIDIRKSSERGHAHHGWLDTYHTFSFADYYDPQHMGFRSLRVINEDRIEGGAGFPTHPHRDMEIVTYVVSGAVAHRDSTGGQGVIRPGMLQHMSAGAGVQHSEFNASPTEPAHLLQIWILPERKGLAPRYSETSPATGKQESPLLLAASHAGGPGLLQVSQDLRLYIGKLAAGETVEHPLAAERHAWLQLIEGGVELNGLALEAGDAASVSNEDRLRLKAGQPAHFLLFDLA